MKTTRMTMMPRLSSGCSSGATKVATLAKLDTPLWTRTVGTAAGPASRLRSWASEAAIDMKRLKAPPPWDSERTPEFLPMKVGLIFGEAAGHVGELGEHEDGDDDAGDRGRPVTTRLDRKRQRQDTPDPGERGTKDEGEQHRERRWDQHVAAEIKRDDRHRANQGEAADRRRRKVAASRRREIGGLHRASGTRS